MDLDITGKVGIRNALEQLEERLRVAMSMPNADQLDQSFMDIRVAAYKDAIEIVKLNLPVKTK